MGRGLFSGRSTPSQTQPHQVISTPTLIATDALPRDDLHTLGEESSFIDLRPTKSRSHKENDRPKTAGSGSGRSRSRSRADPRIARRPPPSIDEQLSPFPPPGGTPTYLDSNDEMIGMALGSPRGDPNWESPSQPSEPVEIPSLPMTTILAGPDERGGDYKPKSQKWKKLGGLFGGRRQQEARGDSNPRSFWDVYAQHAQVQPARDFAQARQPESRTEVRSEAQILPDRPANPPPYSVTPPPRGDSLPVPTLEVRSTPSPIEEVEHEINKMIAHNSWNMDESPISPVDQVDEIPLEPLSPHTSTVDMGRTISPPEEEVRPSPPEHTKGTDGDSESVLFQIEPSSLLEPASFLDTQFDFSQGPLLDIEIPNIQMERYSVMFGSFLTTDKSDKSDRSSILARRQVDKRLERLKTIPDAEERLQEDEPEAEKKSILARGQADTRLGGLKPLPDVLEEMAEVAVEEGRGRDNLPLVQASNPQSSASMSHHEGKGLLEVKPQRRATSPSPVRSPSFSLFPATTQKPLKIHGSSNHHSPAKASGLQRSHTAPGAISPNRTTFESTPTKARVAPQAVNHERFLFKVQSPSQTTSSSSNPAKWSSDGSMLSSVSSQSSEDEDDGEDLILDSKPLMPLAEQEEPAWEVIVPAPIVSNHQREDISQSRKLSPCIRRMYTDMQGSSLKCAWEHTSNLHCTSNLQTATRADGSTRNESRTRPA
jgi:hypothetical protein